ncbi:unnamed protein product [Aphanomyces euteiches]
MDLIPSSDEEDNAAISSSYGLFYKTPAVSQYARSMPITKAVFSSDEDEETDAIQPAFKSKPQLCLSSSSDSSDDETLPASTSTSSDNTKISAIEYLLKINANARNLPVFQRMIPPPKSPPKPKRASSPVKPANRSPELKSTPATTQSPSSSLSKSTPVTTQSPSSSPSIMQPPKTFTKKRPRSPELPAHTTPVAPRLPPPPAPVYISPFGRQKQAADAMPPPPPRRRLSVPDKSIEDDWFSDEIEDEEPSRSSSKKSTVTGRKQQRKKPLDIPKLPKLPLTDTKNPPPLPKPLTSVELDEISQDKTVYWPQLPSLADTPSNGPLVLLDTPEQTVQVHSRLNDYLLSYQREGVHFLFQAVNQCRGAILGDDMGLGKTVQLLSLLSAVLHKDGTLRDKQRRENAPSCPILIVVPASLVANWELECKVWLCASLVVLQGKPKDRLEILESIPSFEIVICSYDMLKVHLSDLQAISWFLIVMDEMHLLKNPESKITQAVQRLVCKRKLGLSGTLMQNNADELHCVLDTIQSGCLGTLVEFRAFYIDDIKLARKKSAAPQAIARSEAKERHLRQLLEPYYLRRDKAVNPQFQQIHKHDQVVLCPLTSLQRAVYERVTSLPEYEALMDPETKEVDPGVLRHHFLAMTQLLKIANHLDLIRVNPSDSKEQQEATKAFAKVAFGPHLDEVGGVDQASGLFEKMNASLCGKMQVLAELLERWRRKREKALIFSRNTRMLDILQSFMISKALDYVRLDGGTKVDERLKLVQQFNKDPSLGVFLISTKAGGLGLNITSATNVVVFDPSWNPAHDCQAQDRAYRIGQTKDVHVYRLITLGTIEEMIYARQIYKQHMSDTTLEGKKAPRYFEAIQGVKSQQGELFGLKNLLQFQPQGVMKTIQDNKNNKPDFIVLDNDVHFDMTQAPPPSTANLNDKDWQLVEELDLSQAVKPTPSTKTTPIEPQKRNLYIPQYLN